MTVPHAPEFLWYLPNFVETGHRGDTASTDEGYGTLDYQVGLAEAVEDAGWSGALLGTSWGRPDTFTVATALAARTTTFEPLIAIRPGYHLAGRLRGRRRGCARSLPGARRDPLRPLGHALPDRGRPRRGGADPAAPGRQAGRANGPKRRTSVVVNRKDTLLTCENRWWLEGVRSILVTPGLPNRAKPT